MIDNFTPVASELWAVADDGPLDGPRIGAVVGWTLDGLGNVWPVVAPQGPDGELVACPMTWRHRPPIGRRVTLHLDLRAAEQRARELTRSRIRTTERTPR